MAPKKKTEIRAVGVPTKKYVAHAPISTAKIFEQVPITAAAVPAMWPIGIKAKVLTLLKRKPYDPKVGIEKIKKLVRSKLP